ncbi:hypothetical protein ACNHKD_15660 [Methylocystis sp. JAN1]|uniref:hypothetical protein n=1 Tax=Methylocystis sp. JAN1 TaxID=3397211 RepID=UPI003FA2B5D5
MKIRTLVVAALAASGVTATAFAMPIASQKSAGLDAQQAHMVQVCEHGRCFWTRDHWGRRGDHWGYGGGRWGYSDDWRRYDRYDRERDWDQDWRRW